MTEAAFCSCVSRLLVALLSAVILPLSAIDPVLSSTSATRSRVLPHLVVDEPSTVMFCIAVAPSARKKVVGTSAEAVTSTAEPPLAV